MAELRLTPARLDLLRAVDAGRVKQDVLSSERHTFRTDKPGYPGVTAAFDLLQRERLVYVPPRAQGEPRTVAARLTDAGRAALDANPAKT